MFSQSSHCYPKVDQKKSSSCLKVVAKFPQNLPKVVLTLSQTCLKAFPDIPQSCLKGSSWKGPKGIESTRKIFLVSNSEIKAGKEQFDHDV